MPPSFRTFCSAHRLLWLSQINLGVLKDDEVNLIIHGHEPHLAEMLAVASQDPEMIAYAKSKGAKGINLAGMCCTANEILMRHGIPIAGNFLQQELAIVTGAVEGHGRRCPVHHAGPGRRRPLLSYQADHHRSPSSDPGCDAHGI